MPEVQLLDSFIHYEEAGTGDPIVFLHGNPTSSYLWRNVIPGLAADGRCLAPDLIGMGQSGKPNIGYRFFDHARYLDAWFDALDLDQVTIVGHDWGAALGIHWASRNPERVAAIAFMEAIVRPFTWSDWTPAAQPFFEAYRTTGAGEERILKENQFVELLLPAGIERKLEPHEMDAYRKPFLDPKDRLPMLAWPRCLPVDGEPADVVAAFDAFEEWLASTPEVPKLLIKFEPGVEILANGVEWCRDHITGLEIADGGNGLHYVQEDVPETIASILSAWRQRILSADEGPIADAQQ